MDVKVFVVVRDDLLRSRATKRHRVGLVLAAFFSRRNRHPSWLLGRVVLLFRVETLSPISEALTEAKPTVLILLVCASGTFKVEGIAEPVVLIRSLPVATEHVEFVR